MSRVVLLLAAGLYLIAACGPGVPWNMRGVLFAYSTANCLLAWSV